MRRTTLLALSRLVGVASSALASFGGTPGKTVATAAWSSLVAALLVTIPLDARAQAPSSLQATVSGNLLTLSWQPPTTPPSGYLIEAGTASGLPDIASVPVPANPPGITAPVPNGTYFIRVRAIYAGGPGPPSNEVAVTVGCTGPPPAPVGFAVTQGAGGNPIHFSWAPPSVGVTAYRLEAGSGPGLANLATVNLAGSATVFDVQAPPGS
jgi:Fibronectin type III domain